MNGSIIQLGIPEIALSYSLILLTIILSRIRQVGQESNLIIASVRMGAQLLLVGLILHYLFALNSPGPILLVLAIMYGFAIITIASRVKRKPKHFYLITATAILLGCGSAIFFFTFVIIGVEPWFSPRYLIPLTGMIIGNSMTGAVLAFERLDSGIRLRKSEIETLLCLGATSAQAAKTAIREAYEAALVPSINAMAAMGIVFLPGMMTGQILSGTDPMTAVGYQVAVMCVISGSVALTSFIILTLAVKSYFTEADQLNLP